MYTNYHTAAFSSLKVGENDVTMILCKNSIAFLSIPDYCHYLSCNFSQYLNSDYLRLQFSVRLPIPVFFSRGSPILSNIVCGDFKMPDIDCDFKMPDIDCDGDLASSKDSAETLEYIPNVALEQVMDSTTHSSSNILNLCFTDMSLSAAPGKKVVDLSGQYNSAENENFVQQCRK